MTHKTFIFIHDQELLLKFEKNNKFKNLKDYSYVFVGKKDISKISNLKNVLIARNFKNNLEDYPLFTAFTGWYMLWKNDLITTDYVSLIEYDVILSEQFEMLINNFFNENCDLVGYVPIRLDNYHYINNDNWVRSILPAIKKIHNLDVKSIIYSIVKTYPDSFWSSTNNITFKKEIFNEYMNWFEPLIDEIKGDDYCGHAQERAISFFYLTKNKKMKLTNGLIAHFQLNSHGTQTHYVNYDESHKKLINNQI